MNLHPLVLLTAACFAAPTAASAEPPPPGFVSLFNGSDLTGWKVPAGDGGHWKVVDGVIDYDAASEAAGDKALWGDREYGDFVLRIDWRLKDAPFLNKGVPYILPDGTHATDTQGKELRLALPDADSGVYLRGSGRHQVNIWCWPIGSGEMYGVRTDPKTPPELRASVTPRTRADRPVGRWNTFEITVRGSTVRVVLNGTVVIPGATMPDLPARGRIALQHHGARNRDGTWAGPPSLVQFRNIAIRELGPESDLTRVRTLVIAGGHEHETSFYSLFDDMGRVAVASSDTAFQHDIRDRYDVLVLYDFTRDLDEGRRKNLRAFVEAGKGVVVLHHALLDHQTWPWWYDEVVGGHYRLGPEGNDPASVAREGRELSVTPAEPHPITAGIGPFRILDETYQRMRLSPRNRPLLTTDHPESDRLLAWVGPCATSRVVAIQLGHGPSAFGNPSYRALVHNAILWAAGRLR